MSIRNEKNIPYLCSSYLPRVLKCTSRSYQIVKNPYEYPIDMVQADPKTKMGDVFKMEIMKHYDIYIFHGEFCALTDIYKIQDDVTGKIIPYLYNEIETISAMNKNPLLIEHAPMIIVRQPQLTDYLGKFKNKAVYIPSPCSIFREDTVTTSDRAEMVFPDDWVIVSHFGGSNRYYDMVQNAARFIDDRTIAYYEVNNTTRAGILDLLKRTDLMICNHNDVFYSQSAIEAGMMDVPTMVGVYPIFESYIKDSPFIKTDVHNFSKQLTTVLKDIDNIKKGVIGHKFFERHMPENSMKILAEYMQRMQVI